MKSIALVLLLATGVAAAADQPAAPPKPRPTPDPCYFTAGLGLGMTRAKVFENLRFRDKDLKTENVKEYKYQAKGRGWVAQIIFTSDKPDAKVEMLGFSYEPVNVFSELKARYGEPKVAKDQLSVSWNVPACNMVITYRGYQKDGTALGEEIKVERPPKK